MSLKFKNEKLKTIIILSYYVVINGIHVHSLYEDLSIECPSLIDSNFLDWSIKFVGYKYLFANVKIFSKIIYIYTIYIF